MARSWRQREDELRRTIHKGQANLFDDEVPEADVVAPPERAPAPTNDEETGASPCPLPLF